MTLKTIVATIIFIMAAGLFLSPASGNTVQDKGRENLTLPGGKSGPVVFAHHLHQERISDCQICHKDFAQKAGSLEAAINAGDLKKKQVMNKTCNQCHRIKKEDGKKTGPTDCKACHKKELMAK